MSADENPFAELPRSWERVLRSERKAPGTLESYRIGLEQFMRWCHDNGQTPAADRRLVRDWIADLLDSGISPATARARLQAVKRYTAWLADEGEIDTNPIRDIAPPKLDETAVVPFTADELTALIDACKGKTFLDRRDEAIIRLFAETGMRATELLRLTVADVDLDAGLATITRGKGGYGRRVPFGPHTAAAIDRYMRLRRRHRLAETPAKWDTAGRHAALWLGETHHGSLGYHGLWVQLRKRAAAAGVENFHVHKFRHTAATRWLAAGGSEGGLMAVAGWRSPQMLHRYVKATASERAAAEAARLNLGDF